MNSFKKSAIEVLKKAQKPLHSREITREALAAGILVTEGATPEATMTAQLIMDVKNKGKSSDFIKTGPSIFALNPNKVEIKPNAETEEKEEVEEEKSKISSGGTGKGGERLVASELLFRGFNIGIMEIDDGVDIVALDENRQNFFIQVKTANFNSFNAYVFDIRILSFDRHNKGNMFYIFVLRGEKKSDFLIMPSSEIEKRITQKTIREVWHGKRYRINIRMRSGKIYLGNMDHEVNYYLNNWSQIK